MQLEIRNNALHISGYVNAVERESRRLPARMCGKAKSDFVEKITAGAFSRALQRASEVRFLYNHSRDIGSTSDGSLRLAEDAIGLKAEAIITDGEVIKAAKNGELRGWSFGFRNAKDRWEDTEDGIQKRMLDDFDLDEVSILSITPAYIGTSVELRGEDVSETETRSSEDSGEAPDDHADMARTENARHAYEVLKAHLDE